MDRYNSAVRRSNALNRECSALGSKTADAFNGMVSQLGRSQARVAALYRGGVVKLQGTGIRSKEPRAAGDAPKAARKPVPKDAATADPGGGLTGSVGDLLAKSACTDREFRRAVTAADRELLERLRGRLVIWRTMLIERAKEAEGRTVAKVMAGGASYAAEFPPQSDAAALLPGSSLVIAGELREAKGAWTFHVTAWGLKRSIDGGEPMVRCRWPKP